MRAFAAVGQFASRRRQIVHRLDEMHAASFGARTTASVWHAALHQQGTQLDDDWKHLMVVIGALPVMRFLLTLDDSPILLEDALGEPHQQRPRGIQNAGNLRAAGSTRGRSWD